MSLARLAAEYPGPAAFGVPGSGPTLGLVEGLEARGVPVVVPGHEMTAALMAAGLSAVSSEVGLCFAIKGPGFANLAPGLLCGRAEFLPAVAVVEAYPDEPPAGRRHKWMDHRAWAAQACKRSLGIGALGEGWSRLADLARRSWPPGPVLVEHAARSESPAPAADVPRIGDPIVPTGRRPAVVVGAQLSGTAAARRLATLSVPVMTTPAAKGLLDERLEHAAGVYTGAGSDASVEQAVLRSADELFFLGVHAGELLRVEAPYPAVRRLGMLASRDVYPPCSLAETTELVSSGAMIQLLDRLGDFDWGADVLAEAKEGTKVRIEKLGFTPASLQVELDWAGWPATHVLDTGCFTVTGEQLLAADEPSRVLGTPCSRTMGAGVGLALGAAFSGRPVVLWIGDGGIRALGLELRLALEHRLPVLVFHLRDGGFGSIRARRERAPRAIAVGSGAHGWAEGLGFTVRAVSDLGAARVAVAQFFADPRPTLLDVEMEPVAYHASAEVLRG